MTPYNDTCPICLCKISNKSKKTVMHCNHQLHQKCYNIRAFNKICPLCRYVVCTPKKSKLRLIISFIVLYSMLHLYNFCETRRIKNEINLLEYKPYTKEHCTLTLNETTLKGTMLNLTFNINNTEQMYSRICDIRRECDAFLKSTVKCYISDDKNIIVWPFSDNFFVSDVSVAEFFNKNKNKDKYPDSFQRLIRESIYDYTYSVQLFIIIMVCFII